MRPVPLLSDEELEEWGNDSLDVLPEYFGQEQRHTHEDKLTKETTAYVSEPVIGSIKAREEWSRLKKIVKVQSYPRQSTASLWKLITEYHREDCPNLATLAGFTLAHPIHTADCERAFSSQNHIISPLRDHLSSDHFGQMMKIMIEGGKLQEFDYEATVYLTRIKDRVPFK